MVDVLYPLAKRGLWCTTNSRVLYWTLSDYLVPTVAVAILKMYLLLLLLAAITAVLWLSLVSPVTARLWSGLREAVGEPSSPTWDAASGGSRKPDSLQDTDQSSWYIGNINYYYIIYIVKYFMVCFY